MDASEQLAALDRFPFLRLACAIMRNRYEAEDCVQNAFVKAWLHLGQFRESGSLHSWVGSIVVNECRMRLRVLKKAPRSLQTGVPEYPNVRRPGLNQEQRLAQRERMAQLHQEIKRLPVIYRSVILSNFERMNTGISVAKTAANMELTLGAWKSRLIRAKMELRRRVELP